MKHNLKVTFYLMILFFTAQFVGLFLLNQSIESVAFSEDTGQIEVVYEEPPTGRPELEGQDSFWYILVMVLIGTALLLLLIKFKLYKIWKGWFFLAIWGALSIALSVLIPMVPALIIALVLAYFKLFRPNILIHNFTEIFMYGGIAVMIAPLFEVFWAVLLLVAISIYDAIAVWKLKHMITLATAQAENKMFAGLLIPYSTKKFSMKDLVHKNKEAKPVKHQHKHEIKMRVPKGFKDDSVKSAILGGGDIAFPLLFAGSVMTWLIQSGWSNLQAYFGSLLIPLFGGAGLFLLFLKSEKDKFYPAMPFISAGCFLGYAILLFF